MRTILLLAAAATAFAQTGANTITITASRNVTAVPDQVVYGVAVQTDPTATLSDALAKLLGTGITAENLTYVNGGAAGIQWNFELVTPFSKMQETSATLTQLAQPAGPPNRAPAVTFSVTGQRTSQDAQSAACTLTALVSDARREADRIATGAGMHAGAIVKLSDQPAVFPVPVAIFDPIAITGNFSQIAATGFSSFLLATPRFGQIGYTPPATCGLVVQFRLLP